MEEQGGCEHLIAVDASEEELKAAGEGRIAALTMQKASSARGKYERGELRGWEGESRREHFRALGDAVQSARNPELVAKAQRSADHLSDSNFFPSADCVRVDIMRKELVPVWRSLSSHAHAYR